MSKKHVACEKMSYQQVVTGFGVFAFERSFYAHILNTEITTSIWFLRIFPRLFGLVQVPRTPQGPHLLGDFAVARP